MLLAGQPCFHFAVSLIVGLTIGLAIRGAKKNLQLVFLGNFYRKSWSAFLGAELLRIVLKYFLFWGSFIMVPDNKSLVAGLTLTY